MGLVLPIWQSFVKLKQFLTFCWHKTKTSLKPEPRLSSSYFVKKSTCCTLPSRIHASVNNGYPKRIHVAGLHLDPVTLPKTKPLKLGRSRKGKDHLLSSDFQGLCHVSRRGNTSFTIIHHKQINHSCRYDIPVPWILWDWTLLNTSLQQITEQTRKKQFQCLPRLTSTREPYILHCYVIFTENASCIIPLPIWMVDFYGKCSNVYRWNLP